MPGSQAIPAYGTFLRIGDGGAPENFTTVAEVKSINGLQMSVKIDDVTTHSTNTPWRDKLATLLDGGAVAFQLNFIPTDPTQNFSGGVLRDFANRTKRNYKVIFPNTAQTTWAFAAYVQDFKIQAPVDGILIADVTLVVVGQPTLA